MFSSAVFKPYDNGKYLFYAHGKHSPLAYVFESEKDVKKTKRFLRLMDILPLIIIMTIYVIIDGDWRHFTLMFFSGFVLTSLFEKLWIKKLIKNKTTLRLSLSDEEEEKINLQNTSFVSLIALNLMSLVFVVVGVAMYFDGYWYGLLVSAFFSLGVIILTKEIIEKLKQRKNS